MALSPTNRSTSEVCRLCASTDGKKFPIFGDIEDHEPLSYRILICVSVEVASDDVLSRLVCESCLDSVNNWFLFKQLCDSAQETQKKWLGQQSTDASVLEGEVFVKTEPIDDEAHDEEQEPSDLEIKQENLELSDEESQSGTASVLMTIDDPLCLSSLVQHHSLQPRLVKRERGTRANVENIDPEEIDKDISDRVVLSPNDSAATTVDDIKLINQKRKGGVSLLLSKKNICPTCNKEFNTKNSLRRHKLTHTGHRYICKLCQQPYLSGSSLWRHMQAHKGVAPFKCSPCRIEFVGQAEFDIHRLTCTLLSPVKRKVIPVKSDARVIPVKVPGKSLKTVSLKTKRKTFNCTLCTKFFFSKINLTNHIKTHQTRCRYCQRDFKNRSGFQNHMKTHASKIKDGKRIKRYLCKFCPKVLSQWNLAVKHKQSHLDSQALNGMPTLKPKAETTVRKKNIKPYNCLDCSETFVYWKQYMKHKEMHTVNTIGSPRRYTCTICNEQFKGWYSLARHRNLHESNSPSASVAKPNTAVESKLPTLKRTTVLNPVAVAKKSNSKCNICDREFKNAAVLERHLSTHSKAKNFSCHVCGNRMKYATSVHQHLKAVHNIVYQYSLIKPDVRDDDSEGENMTMPTLKKESGATVPRPLSVTPSRTYSCPVCSKQFSTKSLMTSHHQIIHKGANVYRCKHCPQMFRQRSTLVRHESTHLKAENELSEIGLPSMFTCEGCPLTFDNANARDLHQRKENHNVMDIKLKIYSCTLCQNSYITELALHSHRFKKHGVSTPLLIPNTIHTCYICHKSFNNHVAVRRHLRTKHLKVEREEEPVVNEPSTSTSSSTSTSNNNTCNICNKRFKNTTSMISHQGWHSRTSYTSPSVLYHTKKVASLTENREAVHINDVDENTCKICDKSFQTTKAFKIHTTWHIRRKEFERPSSNTCSVCEKSFASVKAFKIHTAWHLREQKVKNENSSTKERSFPDKTFQDLKSHKINEACHAHTPSNNTSNADVNKTLAKRNTRASSLDVKPSNVTQIAREKRKLVDKSKEECKSTCSICLLTFPTSSALQSHTGWHNRNKVGLDGTRECTYCHKKFSSSSNVHRHRKICRRRVDVVPSKNAVQVSGQIANNNMKLESRNTVQSSSSSPAGQSLENALTCGICSKQFTYQRSFHNHQRLHVNKSAVTPEVETVAVAKTVATSKAPILVKSWQCDLCPQAFLGQKALTIHRNMHLRKLAISSTNKPTTSKPLQVASLTCNVCKKVFGTPSGLSRHRQIHIREIFSNGTAAKVKRKYKRKKLQTKEVETVLNYSHETSSEVTLPTVTLD